MDQQDEISLRDLITLLRRGLLLALLAAVAAGAATYFYSQRLPAVFEARATLVAAAPNPNQRDFGVTLVTAPSLDAATYVAAIRSNPVLAEALRSLRGRTTSSVQLEELQGRLTLRSEGPSSSAVIRILVRHGEAATAAAEANAIAEAAVRWDEGRATRSLEIIIESLSAQIVAIDAEIAAATAADPIEGLVRNRADLQLQLSSARALRTAAVGRLEVLEQADPPRTSVAPRPARNAAIAALLAIFLSYGALLLREALDTRIRGADDLTRLAGLPLMAEFPKISTGRRGLPMEASSYLRTAVSFAVNDAHPKVILVTSSGQAHGKSSVSAALAESFARQQFRTLLIDADLRKPVLASEYGIEPTMATSTPQALTNPTHLKVAAVSLAAEIELDVLPTFKPAENPTELLANRFRHLLDQVAGEYDVIIIDSAPVLPVADTLTIAPYASGVIFCVSVPQADRRHVRNALDLLQRLGVRVIGTVATNVESNRRSLGQSGYGYGYGYGAGYGPREGQSDSRAAASN